MHVNARIDDKKAKAAKRAALDHDYAGWSDILDRALDLYIERYAAETVAVPCRTNSARAHEE